MLLLPRIILGFVVLFQFTSRPASQMFQTSTAVAHAQSTAVLSLNLGAENALNKDQVIPIQNLEALKKTYSQLCLQSRPDKTIDFGHPWMQEPNILLIVVFNKPHTEVIPLLEVMYRPFFPRNILYCAPGSLSSKTNPWRKDFNVTFITRKHYQKIKNEEGFFNYECVINAITMYPSVDGYLVIGDDTLFHASIVNLDHSKTWYVPFNETMLGDVEPKKVIRNTITKRTAGWTFRRFKKEVLGAWKAMPKLSKSSVVTQCYKKLQELEGGQHRMIAAFADIYYIPQRIAPDFSAVSTYFLSHKIFLEMVVPTAIHCLENLHSVKQLIGIYEWNEPRRDRAWVTFTKHTMRGKVYLHPAKWSGLLKPKPDKRLVDVYCDTVLPWLHDKDRRFRY